MAHPDTMDASKLITINRHDIDVTVRNRFAKIVYLFDFKNNHDALTNPLKFDVTLHETALVSHFQTTVDGQVQTHKFQAKPPSISSTHPPATRNTGDNTIELHQTYRDIPNLFTISGSLRPNARCTVRLSVQQYLTKKGQDNYIDIEILKQFAKYRIIPTLRHISFAVQVFDQFGIKDIDIAKPSKYSPAPIIEKKATRKDQKSVLLRGKIEQNTSSLNELRIKYRSHLDEDGEHEDDESLLLLDTKSGHFVHVIRDFAVNNSRIFPLPPKAQHKKQSSLQVFRRVVFVVDRSLKADERSWRDQVCRVLFAALDVLKVSYDKVGMVVFDSVVHAIAIRDSNDAAINPDVHYLLDQRRDVSSLGVNINEALLRAVDLIKAHQKVDTEYYVNQVIVLSAAHPSVSESNTYHVAHNVKRAMQDTEIAFYSFGIAQNDNDQAWAQQLNHSLLRVLSVNTRGYYQRIKQQMMGTQLMENIYKLRRPILWDVQLAYKTCTKYHVQTLSEPRFDILYSGNELIVCGKLSKHREKNNDDGGTQTNNEQKDDEFGDVKTEDFEISIEGTSCRSGYPQKLSEKLQPVILALNVEKNNKTRKKTKNNTKNNDEKTEDEEKKDEKDEYSLEKVGAYFKLKQLAERKWKIFDAPQSPQADDEEALSLSLKHQFLTLWTCIDESRTKKNDSNKDWLYFEIGNQGQQKQTEVSPEFREKVKEIERRIIQHLHQRGYDENHPDYHRYIAKARELALQKAEKQRQILLKQKKQQQQQQQHFQKPQHVQQQQQQPPHMHPMPHAPPGAQYGDLKQNPPQNSTGSKKKVKGLIILRGLPGSGKTTLARKIAKRSQNSVICSEDKYHWSGGKDGVGVYKFEPQLVFEAREWCNAEIEKAIEKQTDLVIIDNHNARISMYEPHIVYAVQKGYRFRIIEFVANSELIEKYRQRSMKSFPKMVYSKLLKLWEVDPRAEIINPLFVEEQKQPQSDTNNATMAPPTNTINTPGSTSGGESDYGSGDAYKLPTKYEVLVQARVRTERDLKSEHITDLPEGSIVTVEEVRSNRARISAPCGGWISIRSTTQDFGLGKRIIMPKTREFGKLGGKVLFKQPPNYPSRHPPLEAIIVDYDEIRKLYQVKYVHNNALQWIDLRDPNIMYIKQSTNTSSSLMDGGGSNGHHLNATASEFRMQTNEAFFNQFFCQDYPQYAAQPTSTLERMDIIHT